MSSLPSRRALLGAIVALCFVPATAHAASNDPTGPNPCTSVHSDAAPFTLDPERRDDLATALRTPIMDGSYALKPRDLAFLEITPEQVSDWRRRAAPLTMTPAEYRAFSRDLYHAAFEDGLTGRLDARMKGSGTTFFSSRFKSFPDNAAEAAEAYAKAHKGQWPKRGWCSEVADKLQRWIGDTPDRQHPKKRPFDSMFRLGIEDEPSDIDVQLSSDEAVAKTQAECVVLAVKACEREPYGFFDKKAAHEALPHLAAFEKLWSGRLHREVAIAVFPLSGPPNEESGFKMTDWVIGPTSDYDR
jgi:hypothetical protein